MDKQQAFDRGILIPMFIGGFSVIGIVVVLLIGRSLNSPPEVPVTPSETRFQYQYLGTEPAITTPLVEETETPATGAPTGEPVATDGSVTPTRPGPPTPNIPPTPTTGAQQTNTPPPPTSTSASAAPLNPGTYDDVDSHLVYNGWNAATVAGAYGNTLHVSVVPGSTISFRFIGKQVRIIYQGGSTLGRIQISITGSNGNVQTETLDQSTQNEWPSDLFPNGTYSVTITHLQGGGSVNIDQIIIREPPNTPTPTPTSTRRP
jgi:hypothetical protein